MRREEAARLVEAHGQAVYRLAYARTGSREDAEDITQETFLRLVRASPAFRDEAHCRAWLLHVAMNCTRSLFRFYYEELTVEQIAKILGLREGAVRTRLSRARGMLRDMLKEDEEHA